MADQADGDSKGWGHQVGQALAVLIPAVIAGIGGYMARGSDKGTTPPPPPTEVPTWEPVEDVADLTRRLSASQASVQALRAKMDVMPSEMGVSAGDYKASDTTDMAKCGTTISEGLAEQGIAFDRYGDRLFQLKNAQIGLYMFCNTTGHVSYFAVGSEEMGPHGDYLGVVVKKAFEK